ncbi:hypothetical protein PR048_026696 [Dryococelus australis]|uniref:Integrase catalytic domain-containing protein n=1 Tax=Dryococelus australis TaxID=614101 RepID=A0ABQ9GM38_9NEOP|nr:hypothetical protein PR048_026696 [Dryococelus australis]
MHALARHFRGNGSHRRPEVPGLNDKQKEYVILYLQDILKELGIRQTLTRSYTPQHNGYSEKENHILVETAHSVMHAYEEIPQVLWTEMINTAAYILNRTGPSSVNGKPPYELWIKEKPEIEHLRIIGSTCYAHISKQQRIKMDEKTEKKLKNESETERDKRERESARAWTQHFFVRELVTKDEIGIRRVDFEDQVADMMTKPIHEPRLISPPSRLPRRRQHNSSVHPQCVPCVCVCGAHCEELTDTVLDSLGEKCRCLKHLDVSYCDKMTHEAAELLRARLPSLNLVRATSLHSQMAGWDFHPPPPPTPFTGLRRLFRR